MVESKRGQRRKSWKRNKNKINRKWNVMKRKLHHKKHGQKVSVSVVDDVMSKKALNVIKRAKERKMDRVEVE